MNKSCTTCKWEPDWEEDTVENMGYLYGKCKIIPFYIQTGAYRKDKDGKILYELFSYNIEHHPIEDCNLWESKDAKIM